MLEKKGDLKNKRGSTKWKETNTTLARISDVLSFYFLLISINKVRRGLKMGSLQRAEVSTSPLRFLYFLFFNSRYLMKSSQSEPTLVKMMIKIT